MSNYTPNPFDPTHLPPSCETCDDEVYLVEIENPNGTIHEARVDCPDCGSEVWRRREEARLIESINRR